jgi:hypothetical protein
VIIIAMGTLAVQNRSFVKTLGHLLAIAAVGWLVIWAGYFGKSRLVLGGPPLTGNALPYVEKLAKYGTDIPTVAKTVSHFLPADYAKGLFMVADGASTGRGWYLLSMRQGWGGVWFFFPVLYLLKSQIAGLALVIAALVLAIRRQLPKDKSSEYFLLVLTLVVYGYSSMTNKLDLGIRHIMPILPLFSIVMAIALLTIAKLVPKFNWIPSALLACYILPAVYAAPNLIGYTNLFVEPPTEAWRYFNDSNLDWGQQAKYAATVAKEEYPGQPIYTNYPWNGEALRYFGMDARSFNPAILPSPGIVMVTATQLGEDSYKALRRRTPDRIIGNHTFFYRIP